MLVYLLNEQSFPKILILNKRFIEQAILLNNKPFYWTSDIAERSFSEKTKKMNGKWTIIWEKTKSFFWTIEKKNEMSPSRRWTNKIKKVERSHLHEACIIIL